MFTGNSFADPISSGVFIRSNIDRMIRLYICLFLRVDFPVARPLYSYWMVLHNAPYLFYTTV